MTDPGYARRVRDQMEKGSLDWDVGELMKVGRHFRISGFRIVVGRNQEDNSKLEGFVKKGFWRMEVLGHPGPVTLVEKGAAEKVLEAAAELTVKYSDAPGENPEEVEVRKGRSRKVLLARGLQEKEARKLMV